MGAYLPLLQQVFNIRFALDYGAIAQLGERNTGSVEVSGSIPLGSTNNSLIHKHFICF